MKIHFFLNIKDTNCQTLLGNNLNLPLIIIARPDCELYFLVNQMNCWPEMKVEEDLDWGLTEFKGPAGCWQRFLLWFDQAVALWIRG